MVRGRSKFVKWPAWSFNPPKWAEISKSADYMEHFQPRGWIIKVLLNQVRDYMAKFSTQGWVQPRGRNFSPGCNIKALFNQMRDYTAKFSTQGWVQPRGRNFSPDFNTKALFNQMRDYTAKFSTQGWVQPRGRNFCPVCSSVIVSHGCLLKEFGNGTYNEQDTKRNTYNFKVMRNILLRFATFSIDFIRD